MDQRCHTFSFGHYHQAPGASCGILYYPGLVSCPFYAIPIIIPFLIYEIFHLLVMIVISIIHRKWSVMDTSSHKSKIINFVISLTQ